MKTTPSANGQLIEVRRSNGKVFEVVASWPAPFFAFIDDSDTQPPFLYHAETLEAAQRFGGLTLNADFTPYDGKPFFAEDFKA